RWAQSLLSAIAKQQELPSRCGCTAGFIEKYIVITIIARSRSCRGAERIVVAPSLCLPGRSSSEGGSRRLARCHLHGGTTPWLQTASRIYEVLSNASMRQRHSYTHKTRRILKTARQRQSKPHKTNRSKRRYQREESMRL